MRIIARSSLEKLFPNLEDLRERNPRFDKNCELFYRKMRFFSKQKTVIRQGYRVLGCYPEMTLDSIYHFVSPVVDSYGDMRFLPLGSPIDDAHHGFILQCMVTLFRSFFEEIITTNYPVKEVYWDKIHDALIFHEIGENVISDLLADGSYDKDEKDRKETKIFNDFMKGFPEESSKYHSENFSRVQDPNSLAKAFDAFAFVLGVAFLHAEGFDGSYEFKMNKSGLGKIDAMNYAITKSDRPIDNLFLHFVQLTKKCFLQPIFLGIGEAIYRVEFHEPGPPEVIKKFYN
ncbi:hypothetical protein IKG02_00040 [Candidatus Saccharibacteria bacterium]|nr:hypothetical protein [Candidatus Saccharibacteria bacterium]